MVTVISQLVSKLWKDRDGATAIEYGLIAALIAVVIIGAVSLVGTDIENTYSRLFC